MTCSSNSNPVRHPLRTDEGGWTIDLQLADKSAFISGSTGGIGGAIAERLAGEGVRVVLNGRDESRVDAAVERLRERHPMADVTGMAADVSDARSVASLLDTLGPVDILVNNTGTFELADFADITDDDWQRFFDTNLMSAVRLARHLLPAMLESGWGRILFVNTESAVNVPANMIHYGATKAATLALGNGLAKLTAGTEVTVNSILGGPTWSDGVARAVEGIASASSIPAEQMKASIMGGNPTSLLQRFIDPEEIAHLAAYLASPLSAATNGAALRADGGMLTALL